MAEVKRKKRKKHCIFCVDPSRVADYKNLELLREFMDERGRIRKGRQVGSCRKHHSRVAQAIKRAREMALLPYEVR